MSSLPEQDNLIDRREALRRVSALLGGAALVGGSSLLGACGRADEKARDSAAATGAGRFTAADIAYLDEVAETILPETKTPGAKAAKVGAFMALMVTDTYDEKDQQIFRDGMQKLDAASQEANGAPFMKATPAARLALLEKIDREAKEYTDRREAASNAAKVAGTTAADTGATKNEADKYLPDQRSENAVTADAATAPAITADAPPHWFRMMKELTLLGYFTSEIGYTKAMRYVESPGRYDPCVPYTKGEVSWAPHA
jgi:hypothetical protein